MTNIALILAAVVAADPTPAPAVQLPVPPPKHDINPGAGAFGIRAGFGGSTATPGIDVGNVGAKVFLTDTLALSADLGIGLLTGAGYSEATFAVDAVVGIYLRSRMVSVRPYVPLLVGLGFASTRSPLSGSGTGAIPGGSSAVSARGGLSLAAGAGIGAEYWFTPSFSCAAELMFRLEAVSLDPLVMQLGTVTPGIHATYWF